MKKVMFLDRYNLTQAVIDGRKTMTRRNIPKDFFTQVWDVRDDTLVYEDDYGDFIDVRHSNYNQYRVRDVVAIAQSYESVYHEQGLETMDMLVRGLKNSKGWRNKLFVKAELIPHRIRITNVKIERLQDISDIDCMAEGINYYEQDGFSWSTTGDLFDTPREAFAALMDKVLGRGTWDSNPYVFVYEFKLI